MGLGRRGSHRQHAMERGVPRGHRIPKVLMEVRYLVGDFADAAPDDFTFGMGVPDGGDTEGYGAHVDFVAGWNPEFLDASLKTSSCHGTPGSSKDANCPAHQFIGVQRTFTPK